MENIQNIIIAFGYIGVFVTVFAESGLFFGFFLPGDSLLFTLGLLASQGYFNIWILLILCISGAILGDNFGYFFGKKFGPKIFKREDSVLFHKRHVDRTRKFYERHGKKAVFLARFIPIVRTFTPIFAGIGEMRYKLFFSYNILGGFFWAGGMTLLGFLLGDIFPQIEQYFLLVIGAVIIISFIPIIKMFKK